MVGRTEVAAEVDADHVVPLALGHVDDEAVAEDAGVVDEDVDVAVRLDRRVDQRAGALPVGGVAAHADRLAPGGPDLGGDLLGRVALEI